MQYEYAWVCVRGGGGHGLEMGGTHVVRAICTDDLGFAQGHIQTGFCTWAGCVGGDGRERRLEGLGWAWAGRHWCEHVGLDGDEKRVAAMNSTNTMLDYFFL